MKYPHDHENDIIYFGKTNFRNQMRKFGIKTDDRRRHTYVIGKTGMGKTTLLENMILSDIYAGHGCCYIDPHGDTAEGLLDYIPSWRINDVVYFNPADINHPVGFNILESVDDDMKHLVAAGMMGVFKKIWENVWSARMEYILNNTILALLDNPGSTLLGINRVLSDKGYRKQIIGNVQDPIVRQFWVKEFAQYQDKFATEAVAPIQNKVGQFLSASVVRNIVAQAHSTIRIREIMDEEKIFIVNLSKGRIGEDASRLLGGMLITKIQMSAMERVDTSESDRTDFYLYVDEFQNFAVESFASILSEARKYRLNLIMAHQYIAQLTEEVRDAVFGNVGTMITFRVGSPDAQFMEDEFMPRFTPEDIINLPKFQIYLKLMIDGVSSQPFSAMTLPPIAHRTGSELKVIEQSRERYGIDRKKIEQHVVEWSGFGGEMDMEKEFDTALKDAKKKRKEKFLHQYNCTRCNKEFGLPVELDRSRPIYCEDCHPIVKEERNKGKQKKEVEANAREVKQKKKVLDEVPKIRDGEIVKKEIKEETVSLSALTPKEEKREKKASPKRDSTTEESKRSQEIKEQAPPDQDVPRAGDLLKSSPPRSESEDVPASKEVTTITNEKPQKEEQKEEKKNEEKTPSRHPETQEKNEKNNSSDAREQIKEKQERSREDQQKKVDQPTSQEGSSNTRSAQDANEEESGKRKRKRRKRRRKKKNGGGEQSQNTDSGQKQEKTSPLQEGDRVKNDDNHGSTSLSPGEIVRFD